MSITGKQLAAFAIRCYQEGVRYWYGTCYYKCSASLLASKTKQYPTAYTAARQKGYRADIAAGARCCDCIGLIKGAMWSDLGAHESRYGSNACPDKGADGMLTYCKQKEMPHGGMDSFPDEPGLLLHKAGHVGVSIGSGMAIEARSFADDLVRAKVDGRGWTSWARLPFVAYEDTPCACEDAAAPDTAPIVRKLGERTLRRGMRGYDVSELQTALVYLGYDCGSYGAGKDGVDGNYGYTTQAAVTRLQRDADIEADGIYGPITHAALGALLTAGQSPQPPEGGSPEDGGSMPSGDAAAPSGDGYGASGEDDVAVPSDDRGADATYTVTIPCVDAATATYLLEAYAGATACEVLKQG